MDDMAQSLQPKERVCSTGYMELSCRLCTKLSYRNATEMINLFQHRDAGETIKLRTLSDSVERVGEQISARLEEMTQKVLKMYGFDSETGRPMEGVCLSASITSPAIPEKTEADIQAVDIIIDSANASRDEKIPFTAEELDMGDLTIGMCVCIHRRCGVKTSEGLPQPGNGKECKVCGKHSGSYPVWTGHICPDSVRHEKTQ